MGRIVFVTGTDTGVGKTLLTALLLASLRQRGVHALAMKPFCSGERTDVAMLQAFQPGELSDDEVNPLWFKAPLAPLLAARRERRRIEVKALQERVRAMARRCEVLLVEGAGGALVPLTAAVTVADFAAALRCEVLLVAGNRLGAINHVRLTLEALEARGLRCRSVVMMDSNRMDLAARGNAAHLRESLANIGVYQLPYLGRGAMSRGVIERRAKKLQIVLARILGPAIFTVRSLEPAERKRADQNAAVAKETR